MKLVDFYYHVRVSDDSKSDHHEIGTFHVKRKFSNISNSPETLAAIVYSKSLADFIVEACNEKELSESK
jgi:hypothetical protein